MSIQRTAIIGAGGWGTALAILWSKRGNDVILWGNNAGRAEHLRKTRENADYLPGVTPALMSYAPAFLAEQPEAGRRWMIAYLRGARAYWAAFRKGEARAPRR